MDIIKRDGKRESYDLDKIKNAMRKAFISTKKEVDERAIDDIALDIDGLLSKDISLRSVEKIQDLVEEKLMERQLYQVAKNYILYRQKRFEDRQVISELCEMLQNEDLRTTFIEVEKTFRDEEYDLKNLLVKFRSFYKEDMSKEDRLKMLIKASVELISKEAPKWEYIAAYFLSYELHDDIKARMAKLDIKDFAGKVHYLTDEGYYGRYILEHYSDEELDEAAGFIDDLRDHLFTYSGLDLIAKRYLMIDHDHHVLETPQEMFLGIALHLMMNESDRLTRVRELYDILSRLEVTMATPTMANARKPYHQLSSCFIDTVDDTLKNIYKSIDNFAEVSKYGGGMGLYFGKVRANGSDIRGFKGAAGGVIRWIKLVNDTAVAVDQLGVRAGAVAVYLDAWHKDLPEFLNLRTNNGDDRMKAHDVFPAVCYPDLFWKMCKEDLDAKWYLMCPHEIHKVKGYHLEDYYGKEWEERYFDCVNDSRISKREMVLKDLVRLILKSQVETGTPFTFNRDIVNRANPNSHKGIIYCSNLCTEIAQNMKPFSVQEEEVVDVDGEKVITQRYKAGDFVVCNLASLSLGNLDVNDKGHLREVIRVVTRTLDNVIDLNFYPIEFAKITNQRYRPIGLGVSGYHHMLVKNGINFESEEHLTFVDRVFEDIAYFTIEASKDLAKEKGRYRDFVGSDWDTGAYFKKRGYEDTRWQELAKEVHDNGLRNAWLLAIAPTSSTSIIAGTTAGVDPIMNKFFYEEKKGSMIARVAPDLDAKTFWLYKNAHLIDQTWVVRSAGIRQRHIDQAQSVNLYITNDFTMRQILRLYIEAYENGVKTIYYVRSKSLEVEECESCAS